MAQTVDMQFFLQIVRHMMRMILTVYRETEVLHRLVDAGVPLPQDKRDAIRQKTIEDVQPSFDEFAQTSDERVLEFLRKFEGTIQ